jgi:membrane protein implicated in regulation of membrane protease activity
MTWWYWFATAFVLLLFELASPGLFLYLSFCFGAFSGGITSLLGYSLVVQMLIALMATSLSLIILAKWVREQLHHWQKDHHTNIFALVGKHGIIIKQVEAYKFGQVKINGEVWSCRSLHEEQINIGQEVVVMQVCGAHVVVALYTKCG